MDYSGEAPMTMHELNYCVDQAVSRYDNVHPIMIKTILSVEGGQIGTVRRNTDRSYDVGPMQINTIHAKDIAKEFGYSMRDIAVDGCKNIMVGSWLLSKHLKQNANRVWLSMGNYHSKTASLRRIYLKKLATAYVSLVEAIGKGNEASAIGRTVNWGRPSGKPFVPSLDELEKLIGQEVPSYPKGLSTPSSPPVKKPVKQVMNINSQDNSLRFID